MLNEMDHILLTTTTEHASRVERPLLSTEVGMFLFISIQFPESLVTSRNHLYTFGRGHHEERFCEIILHLDQWFRRRSYHNFLSRALAPPIFCGAEPFVKFW